MYLRPSYTKMYEKKKGKKGRMLKFIIVASVVILFLIFSIPLLIWEEWLGKKDPEKKDLQSLHVVQTMFRQS